MSKRTVVPLALLAGAVFAGPKLNFDDGKRSLEIQQTYQIWSVLDFDPQRDPEADARADVFVRRARLTFKGQGMPGLEYQFGFAVDNMGKDSLTGVGGGPQLPATTTFQQIDALAWYHTKADAFVAAAGLMTPHLNRELFASFAGIPSLDQALTYSYVRDHYTTRNTGRETGIVLASTGWDSATALGYAADFGVWDNSWNRSATSSTPTVDPKWSPLLTGRLALNLFGRENKGWKTASDNSTRAEGFGATVGAFGAWKGETDILSKKDSSGTGASKTYTYAWQGGAEALDAWGADVFAWAYGATLQAEWIELGTSFSDSVRKAMPSTYRTDRVADHVWGVRLSWIAPWELKGRLEPVVGWHNFEGDPASPRYKGGWDEQLDLGVNWLLDGNKAKLSLHYLNNNGEPSSSYTTGVKKDGTYVRRSDCYALGLQLQL